MFHPKSSNITYKNKAKYLHVLCTKFIHDSRWPSILLMKVAIESAHYDYLRGRYG